METFRGRAHLPGADKERNLDVDIDWADGEVNVHIAEAPGGLTDWPGLAVQTFGALDEVVFRTKGIPQAFTHWWHFVRSGSDDLWGIVLGLPDVDGRWRTCPVMLQKVQG